MTAGTYTADKVANQRRIHGPRGFFNLNLMIQFTCSLDKITTRMDGSLAVTLGLEEMVPDMMSQIFALKAQGAVKVTLEAIPNLN